MRRRGEIGNLMAGLFVVYVVGGIAYSWEPLAVVDDPNVFMPGSQPGDATLE
jgi:hypothetical protein